MLFKPTTTTWTLTKLAQFTYMYPSRVCLHVSQSSGSNLKPQSLTAVRVSCPWVVPQTWNSLSVACLGNVDRDPSAQCQVIQQRYAGSRAETREEWKRGNQVDTHLELSPVMWRTRELRAGSCVCSVAPGDWCQLTPCHPPSFKKNCFIVSKNFQINKNIPPPV